MNALGFRFVALLALCVVPIALPAASIVYDVDLDMGTGNLSGTIQTNGMTGRLERSDILDWNLTLSYGDYTFALNDANATLNTTQLIFATADGLMLDFNSAFVSYFRVMRSIGPFEYVAVDAFPYDTLPAGTQGHYGFTHEVIMPVSYIYVDGVDTVFPHIVDFGTASAVVPAPETMWLLLSAVGLLPLLSYRR